MGSHKDEVYPVFCKQFYEIQKIITPLYFLLVTVFSMRGGS